MLGDVKSDIFFIFRYTQSDRFVNGKCQDKGHHEGIDSSDECINRVNPELVNITSQKTGMAYTCKYTRCDVLTCCVRRTSTRRRATSSRSARTSV